ncbi:YybH family protein [Bacteroidota bacterium]
MKSSILPLFLFLISVFAFQLVIAKPQLVDINISFENIVVNKTQDEVLNCTSQMEKFWNEGDLENYMDFYWNSDSLTMQSSNARYYGWENINAMFVNMFQDENLRGELKFSEIEIPSFSDETALVIGKFHLDYPNGQMREGYFTVIFKKIDNEWKIIHDQS